MDGTNANASLREMKIRLVCGWHAAVVGERTYVLLLLLLLRQAAIISSLAVAMHADGVG